MVMNWFDGILSDKLCSVCVLMGVLGLKVRVSFCVFSMLVFFGIGFGQFVEYFVMYVGQYQGDYYQCSGYYVQILCLQVDEIVVECKGDEEVIQDCVDYYGQCGQYQVVGWQYGFIDDDGGQVDDDGVDIY